MKRLLCTLIVFISLLYASGCSRDESEKTTISVDTVGVVAFTDKIMKDNGYDIIEKSVSQRTDNTDKFIVEYWWQKDGDNGHYGYYIQQDDNNYIVLEEGDDINNDLFN